MAGINDDIADEILTFNSQLPRLEGSLRRKVRARLKHLEATLLKELAGVDPAEPTRTAYKKKRLEALLKKVHNDIVSTYAAIRTEVQRETIAIARLSAETTTGALNKAVGVNIASVGVGTELLEKIVYDDLIEGAKSSEWWSRQAGAVKFKFQREIGDAIQLNETLGDMTRRIRGTRARGFKDGIMSASTKDAESLIRTSVVNASNGARVESMQANADILKGIQWVSTLDSSTTPKCRALDGLVWNLDYKPINHSLAYPGNTAHWGCRSGQAPVLKKFSNLPKNKRKKIPVGTRASIDGQVSATTTYDAWLKKKDKTSPAFVKETLGPSKYKIWKEQGLSMRDMVDQYSNPLTVTELQKRYN